MTTPEYEPTREEQLFLKYYGELMRQTIHARAHLKLNEHLEDYRSNYLRELNIAPHFFKFTIKAHLDDAFLTLSRILDLHEDSLSIWKLLNFVEQNHKVFSNQAFCRRMKGIPHCESLIKSHTPITLKEIEEDRQRLVGLENTVSNIKELRDKSLAHTDRTFHLGGKITTKKFTFQRKNLYEVIESLVEILNRYSVAYNASSVHQVFRGEADVQRVMDYIRSGIEERDKKLKEIIRQTQATGS